MSKKLSAFLCCFPVAMLFLSIGPLTVLSMMIDYELVDAIGAIVGFILMLLGILVWAISLWGVMIWLIVRTIKKPDWDGGKKALWVIALYVFNMIAYPVYWLVVIREEN